MDEHGSFPQWILWAVGIVVGTLASVVGYLYKVTQTQNTREIAGLAGHVQVLSTRCDALEKKCDEQEKAIKECEVDRGKQSVEIASLQRQVQRLKSKYEGESDGIR